MSYDTGMGTVTIRLHYPSEESYKELIEYLENQCWDYTEDNDFKRREMDGEIKPNELQE